MKGYIMIEGYPETVTVGRGNNIGARSYGSIASILQHGLDRAYAQEKAPDGAPIKHANIRGRDYYH